MDGKDCFFLWFLSRGIQLFLSGEDHFRTVHAFVTSGFESCNALSGTMFLDHLKGEPSTECYGSIIILIIFSQYIPPMF